MAHQYAVPAWFTAGRDYAVPLALSVALAAGPTHAFPFWLATRRPPPTVDVLRRIGVALGLSVVLALVVLAPVAYVLVTTDDGALQVALGLLALLVLLPASIHAGTAVELRLHRA